MTSVAGRAWAHCATNEALRAAAVAAYVEELGDRV